ncbi:RagB/SusD family nutrient uptake outer membrane protein [Paraflavitalea sp. CAU 1676]|uniref:RagB/SusD family nutrient uptake outer membrane protein n=1 Tax=Paraflavitalea sp. CAU 1676 TaxID=3032598 RepID=UPI0023D98E61|nr:RagB/SusD family nutrient uptake outer membrane protein [Paraflavitalea sp. CAU 1676]MDF2192579.1 RagB/SusD family nutrient uptake outer membrane protein [Paraflavitalea sp. CAU 1676]
MHFNKLIYTFLLLVVAGSVSSCKKFLDQVPDDKQTIDDVFKKKASTEQYLAGVYGYIRWENDPWKGLSDELDITYNDDATYAMNLGSWDINRSSFNFWTHYYRGIRTATYFMQRVEECPEIEDALKVQYKAEAKALRAYFYSRILAQYGPFVILPDVVIAPDADIKDFSFFRSSYDECVAYIEKELDGAVPNLPATQGSSQEYGRIKKGIALAMKSRMLLYAASPLYNGNTGYANFKNSDGKQLISQTYDANKWKKAADAAKAVIDMPDYSLYRELDGNGKVKPFESLKNVFLKDWNPEVIMARVDNDALYNIDKYGTPYSIGGWSSHGPTQQSVDAYFMANGRSIDDPLSGYVETGFTNTANSYYAAGASNMYVGREPRFYIAITFNLSKWINNYINNTGGTGSAPITVQMYKGGNSGQYTGRNWSRTGYIVRKLINPNTYCLSGDQIKIAARTVVMFRLAEIYLNYAEALNEFSPGHADIKTYINLIRERAGIPTYGGDPGQVPEPAGQDGWRTAIRKERRVELAFEQFRYFDTRRWKIAEQTDGGAFYGMDANASNTTDFQKRTVFETRVFQPKMYLWNILQSELNKDKNLVGNPGW